MIGNLQLVRIFAASGVVLYHTDIRFFGLKTQFHGVSLFFVLSGYLMCKISNRSAWNFARDRFYRIVPAYWLATAFLLTLVKMWNWWPVEHTLLSFLFVPHDSVAGLYPVLAIGWTLNIELYFYALFALAILCRQQWAPVIAGSTIMLIWFILPFLTDNKALLFYYSNEEIPYFAIGIMIWYLTEGLKKLELPIKLPIITLPLSLIIYTITIIFFSGNMLAVSLLFLMTVLSSQYGADLQSKWILLFGNASYACYLLHIIFIEFLRHKGIETSGTMLFACSVLMASWVISLAWYLTVEKKLANFFPRSSSGKNSAPAPLLNHQ